MARRRKPGVAGKTTIPLEVVTATRERLQAVFAKMGFAEDYDLYLVAQQRFLYVEVERHPIGCGPDCTSTRTSSARTPLGRLQLVSDDEWEFHPYRWSGEGWDDRSPERGTPEELMSAIVVERLCG